MTPTSSNWTNWKVKLKRENPQKYKQLQNNTRIREYEKKFDQLASILPIPLREFLSQDKEARSNFGRLTRLKFWLELPHYCQVCNTLQDLQIHHVSYTYPINIKDLVVLCAKHHIEEHQKVEKRID
jgi:hypothetical protein